MTQGFGRFQPLINRARKLGPVATAVVYPCSPDALGGALLAHRRGLLDAILIGPAERMQAIAHAEKLALAKCRVVDVETAAASVQAAVDLVRAGEAGAIMKGSLHTDELMAKVVSSEAGLRTARRISHSAIIDVPDYPRLLQVTDAAINIAPDLSAKRDITQNAIDLAHAIGVRHPRVAILSAVETVTPEVHSTIDAAALCKMADRGQISGAILDGPLAFDNAISAEAARIKGIRSAVAGRPDILVAPNLEAGNMLYKEIAFMSHAVIAGVVLGAKVPVVLTSRADTRLSRVASAAIASLMAHHIRAQAGTRPAT